MKMTPLDELEQARLVTLNLMVARTLRPDDGLCAYCGLRPGRPQLCETCEQRRQQLAIRYPGVGGQRIFQGADAFTQVADAGPKEWFPYREDQL